MHSPVLAASILFCVPSFVALPADAAAAGPCDRPILRAEGRMSGWALAPAYKQMIARRLSLRKWEETAAELHGADYARWADAKGRIVGCELYRDHPWSQGRVSCVAAAIPCATTSR
jgi:hypothetical protein